MMGTNAIVQCGPNTKNLSSKWREATESPNLRHRRSCILVSNVFVKREVGSSAH